MRWGVVLALLLLLVPSAALGQNFTVPPQANGPATDQRVQQFFLPGTSTVGMSVHESSTELGIALPRGKIAASGGYKMAYVFAHPNYLSASLSNQRVVVAGSFQAATNGVVNHVMAGGGSVIGVTISSSTALTAAAAHAEAMILDGAFGTPLRAVIGKGLTQTQYAATTAARGTYVFNSGDTIGCRITTDAAITPLTAFLVCTVIVEY